ncbi:MAG TPA: Sir2 family NAD-dependent protein deacetylase, partial [Flavisolibacter sp.]|nr:Sir2 family NAD-dependent protein deacetylase [Flavisolibacter sp.]
ASLQAEFDVTVITQNIDDLHERAGSEKVVHLHGEILKMRSEKNEELVYPITGMIRPGDRAEDGAQLRPDIVWFEEPVPRMEAAILFTKSADIFLIVGTSLAVYPAAGLVNYAPWPIPKYIIDKKIPYISSLYNLKVLEMLASEGMRKLKGELLAML